MLICETARTEIAARLAQLETDFGIRILFACESGSRAWGFPSVNSDYDVRFLYVHPRDWYLSISTRRDVIELPIIDEYDINGWDLRKTLGLLYKSNPALQEWLSCPIVYRTDDRVMPLIQELSRLAFNPTGAFHHYLSMSKQHISKMKNRGDIRLKHYLYTIRPLLACRWLLVNGIQPLMLFTELVETMLEPGALYDEVQKLIDIKRSADEIKAIPHVKVIDRFIEDEYLKLSSCEVPGPRKLDVSKFDNAFRTILEITTGEQTQAKLSQFSTCNDNAAPDNVQPS